MIYGYARVSTKTQKIERQINAIKNYSNDITKIYKDKCTGKTMDRDDWQKLLKVVKKGDIIVFDEVSRMSRTASEGIKYYEMLYNKGVDLVFLNEPTINTSVLKDAINTQIKMTGDIIDYVLEGINKYSIALVKRQIEIFFEQAQKEVDDKKRRQMNGYEAKEREALEKGLPKPVYGHHKKTLNVKNIKK